MNAGERRQAIDYAVIFAIAIPGICSFIITMSVLPYFSLFPGLFVVILVHEFGHCVGTWLAGGRVISISILKLEIRLKDGKYRLNKTTNPFKVAGMVRPLLKSPDDVIGYRKVILGCPLASG